MRRFALATLALIPLVLAAASSARGHCEVPCGIYDDAARFDAMLEDATTIGKAMHLLGDLAGKTDAQSMNQLVRWVNTKETHATHVMETIGQYFLAQRIKAPAAGSDPTDTARYRALLMSSHDVITAAMKCKQTVDEANAGALKAAVEALRKLYNE